MELDKRDKKIIKILQKNSRTPNTDIAQKLDISEAAVRNRIKKLQKQDIIKRFTVEIDPTKIGYNSIALVGVDVEPDKFLTAAEKLSQQEEISDVALTTGDHMIMMTIWAKNGDELTEIITEKIGKIDGIQDICPAVVLEKTEGGFLPK